MDVAENLNSHFMKLATQGKCELDNFGRFSPDCFRDHFFEGVCLNYPDHFPKLFQSLGATVYQNKKLVCRIPKTKPNLDYLETSVKAARACHSYPDTKEEIFYSKGDLISIWMAMIHIETTIVRWDTRQRNNLMDPDEVMDAYRIYAPALDGFLEDMPGIIKKLKKQIYRYLIKYEEVPNPKQFSSIAKFARFLLSFNKEAPANRKTIASILKTISEQGAPETFDCHLLRDPTQISGEKHVSLPRSIGQGARKSKENFLTQSDSARAHEIESESEALTLEILKDEWPHLFEGDF
jgi:hypothetical protein